jgi:hypothetical protein
MEQTESSETSAYKIQTPGNYPEENMQRKNGFSECEGSSEFYRMFILTKCSALLTVCCEIFICLLINYLITGYVIAW